LASATMRERVAGVAAGPCKTRFMFMLFRR
jgi:hypothetical protein